MSAALLATALATAVACGVFCGLAAWAAVASRRRHRQHHAERDAVVRSALYRTLDEPDEPAKFLGDLDVADRKLLEAKAIALLPALRGEDRETLARMLESQGATETARRRCRSRRMSARVAACGVLGDVGSSYALLDLVPLLDDPRPAVRVAAARAIGRLGQPAGVVPLMGAVVSHRGLPVDVASEAIRQIRDWPVSLLHPCLSSPSMPTRALAVELLGHFQAFESVDGLIELLEGDPAAGVRIRAARALGRMGSARAIEPLIGCVRSGPAPLRAEAATALGRLGAASAVPTLRVALLGPSLTISQAAASALSAIDPRGLDVLREIADDPRHPAGVVAHRALAAAQTGAVGRGRERSPLAG